MKHIWLFLGLLMSASVVLGQECPQTLNISTGYDQNTSSLIPDGDPDDDWIITQTPAGLSGFTGNYGFIIPKYSPYDWAGSTSKWMNYQNSGNGPDNFCSNELPWVYQNPFCICGEGEEFQVTISFDVHCDNWAEVWLMDGSGNTISMLLSQVHQEIAANFQNPTDHSTTVHSLPAGNYSIALLQRNKSSVTGVTLDGTITVAEGGGVLSGNECGHTPELSDPMTGPAASNCDGSGEPGTGTGCPKSVNASTGYDQVAGAKIADGQPDDDWILTQVPAGVTAPINVPGSIITKHTSYHWAGPSAKYMNYHNSGTGVNNWAGSQLPFVYQFGFCVCGDVAEEALVTFDLDLHCDNWSEVWLMDASGAPIMLLLSQTYAQQTDNFLNPTDAASQTVGLVPGQYSLALLQRNGTGPTAVSLEAEISSPTGISYGNVCGYEPVLDGTFNGTDVSGNTGGGGIFEPGFEKGSEIDAEKVQAVYPNPAAEVITLKGFENNVNITLTDLQGRVVLMKTVNSNEQVDVSGITAGTYMLQATDQAGHSLTETLIIR